MKHLKRIFLIILPTLLIAGGNVLAFQQNTDVAPQVIAVTPFPGEEMGLDTPLTISFNQGMNQSTVEENWSIEPAIEGGFRWTDDRTLAFMPLDGWEVGASYEVTIGRGAQASNGLNLLDPFTATIRAVGELVISSVIPADDAEDVAADATITVVFNRPVVPLVSTEELSDLPNPLEIEPVLEGTGEWLNTSIYQFTPEPELAGGTTYTVTVRAGLSDLVGSTLQNDFQWSFQTLLPEILSTSPDRNTDSFALDDVVRINFSQSMETTSTEVAFSLQKAQGGEALEGTFEWINENKTLQFQPREMLEIESEYIVRLNAEIAQSATGANLREGRDFRFSTVRLPYIRSFYPAPGDGLIYPGRNTVSITFGTPMDTESFADKFVIEPEPETVTPFVYGNRNLDLQFDFQPNTTYTITILAGTEDVYGNAIEEDFTFAFVTDSVRNNANFVDSGRLAVTGAYRDDTVLPMNISGTPSVTFALYRVPVAYVHAGFRYLYDEELNSLIERSELLREWEQTLSTGTTFGTVNIKLASDEGGVLAPGLYLVVGKHENRVSPVALAVTNTNITLKRSHGELLVWVTDMQTGMPVAEHQIGIFEVERPYDSQVTPAERIAAVSTDAEGIARISDDLSEFITIINETEGQFGIWNTSYEPDPPTQDVYLYTDRPIYRPGETLYYRGVYRARDDFDFSINDIDDLTVTIVDNRGELLPTTPIELTDFGTFSGEIQLPEDAPIGFINIQIKRSDPLRGEVWLGEISAQVAEFRVPEFSVTVEPAQDEITVGETITAVINARFFSGGNVSNADVTWTATARSTFFNYTGVGNYSFSESSGNFYFFDDFYYDDFYGRTVASGEGTTDASGNLVIEIDDFTLQGVSPENITIEATVNDESGQFISGRNIVMVHPSEVYVGIRTDRYFAQEGEPFNAESITVNQDSEIAPNQEITLTLIEKRWEREEIEGAFGRYDWIQRDIEVDSVRVTTDEQGLISHEFVAPNPGQFVITASTFDGLERTHRSNISIWVTGSTPVWWGRPTNNIDLVADKDTYVVGEAAQILVPISLEGTSWVLAAIERDGIVNYEVIEVEGTTLVYEVPILEEYEPGVHVTIVVMHGIDEFNVNPTYRQGTVQLNVEPQSKRLNVTITPSTTDAQPGETVTFDITATDMDGNAVAAEFGLALVDEAILSLSEPNSQSPEDHYYGFVNNFTDTRIMLEALIDGRIEEDLADEAQTEADYGYGGNIAFDDVALAAAPAEASLARDVANDVRQQAQFDDVTVREDFQQTPLWEAHVVTDANGKAQVSVVMPDNLTIWDLTARAITKDTLIAETNLDVSSTLPLLVRPVTPRFFVVNDEVTLAMIVNNNSNQVQDVAVTMRGSGYDLLDGEAEEQSAQIDPNSRARIEWRVQIQDVTGVDLTFIAVGNDGFQDASKPTVATDADGLIPVYRYTAPDTVSTGGVLREGASRTEGISIPPYADTDQGSLTIQIDPSLAVTTIDSLGYLQNFKHQCIEQTVSRFLPNIITLRALQQLNVDDPELFINLQIGVDFAIEILQRDQNSDGGWGWFGGMESDPIVSGYALLGLLEAQQSGIAVDKNMLANAVFYIQNQLIKPDADTIPWQLNRHAFFFYVLSRANDDAIIPAPNQLQALYDVRLEMSDYARAYLLMAFAAQDGDFSNQIDSLTTDLISSAKVSATGAHWEEEFRDWWNWGSDIRSTAVVLQALIEVAPENELLPNVVRWLMVARDGNHWESTQTTAWAVMGLTDWMVAANELEGDYDYTAILNSEELGSGTVTPDTVREGNTLVAQVSELVLDELNRLTITRSEGEGTLYYTAYLRLRLDASEVDAIDRGINVTREYFAEDGTTPISEAEVGDIINVRLTLNVPETIYYFVLEDPLPAGVEALDTSLLTTTQNVPGPSLQSDRDPYFYWWWWIWDHTEIRDESVNLYADTLPPGTYVYSYQARATVPGNFQTMPAHGYAFYFPEVFGRSDGELFTVTNAE